MAPNIDWNAMDVVAKGKSTMDDETIDKVVEDLRAVQESDFKDEPEKLILLFKSALNVFNVSSLQILFVRLQASTSIQPSAWTHPVLGLLSLQILYSLLPIQNVSQTMLYSGCMTRKSVENFPVVAK